MRKSVALFLLIALFAGMTVTPVSASFVDVPETHWAKEYILYAEENALIHGMGDGTFQPEETLTEAQCAQILLNMFMAMGDEWHLLVKLNKDVVTKAELYARAHGEEIEEATDNVPADAWYAPAVYFVKEKTGLHIEPENAITRGFICRLIYAYEVDNLRADFYNLGEIPFSDCDGLDANTATAIKFCVANGIVCGFPDGTFRPEEKLTRAQGAKIFTLLYDYLEDELTVDEEFVYDAASDIVQMAEDIGVTTDVYTVRGDTFYRVVKIYSVDDDFSHYGDIDETYPVGAFYVSIMGGCFIVADGTEMTLRQGENVMREIAKHFEPWERAVIASMHFAGYVEQYGWTNHHSPRTGILSDGSYSHGVNADQYIDGLDLSLPIVIGNRTNAERLIMWYHCEQGGMTSTVREIAELEIRLEPMDRFIVW